MSENYRKRIDGAMSQINYGWVDFNGKKHTELKDFSKSYALQSPNELLNSKLGVCWDQVELERKLLADEGIAAQAFFIVYYDDAKCPTHTFVLFEEGNKIIWYEHAWEMFAGWHEFDNIQDAIRTIRDNFIQIEKIKVENPLNLVIYTDYPAPDKKLNCLDFYHHCEKSPRFKVKETHE